MVFRQAGFTLIELLVTISVIGILSGIVYTNFSGAGGAGRDAKRASDLRALEVAIEQYKNKYGRYPEQGCGTPSNANGNNNATFATEVLCPTSYVNGATGRLFSEFMPRLPLDPVRGSGSSGFSYLTNTNGTVYKVMVSGTVEADNIDYDHPLKRCDVRPAFITNGTGDIDNDGWCTQSAPHGNIHPSHCQDGTSDFENTYAVWGGFEALRTGTKPTQVRPMTNVLCR